MGKGLWDEEGVPGATGAGKVWLWPDNVLPGVFVKDDSGRVWGITHNGSVANQAGFSADTYLTNSGLLIGSFGVQAKTRFEWVISLSKTGAGIAAPIYQVRIGTNQTTADTSRLTLTGPAQTGVADQAVITIVVTVRNVGAAGVLQGTVSLDHNLAATGFAVNAAGVVEGTSAAFDNSALSGNFVGLSINGGSAAAWTLTQVRALANW